MKINQTLDGMQLEIILDRVTRQKILNLGILKEFSVTTTEGVKVIFKEE